MGTQNWDGTPWMVGGGARHSTNVARNVAFGAFGGNEGIVSPTACEVRELETPGAGVRVYPGTVVIENKADGVQDEMYVGRLPIYDEVDISSTDSSGGRSDLIIARVENPHMPGEPWPAVADPTVGPYIFSRVVSGVNAQTRDVDSLGLGYSAIALARIDIPANTSTITQSMITDLRRLSQVQQQPEMVVGGPVAKTSVTSGWANLPAEAAGTVDVPRWATHVVASATLGSIAFGASGTNGGNGWSEVGDLRIAFEGAAQTTYSQPTRYNFSNEGGTDRLTALAGANRHRIPAANRGKPMSLRLQGIKVSGSNGSDVYTDEHSMLSIHLQFINAAESNG